MKNSRRNFLQKLTASAIALPLLSSKTLANMDKKADDLFYDGPVLRVAIMGLAAMAPVLPMPYNLVLK